MIGFGILLVGLRIGTLPIFAKHGFDLAFINLGLIGVLRSTLALVPLLVVAHSDHMRIPSLRLYFIAVYTVFFFDFFIIARLGTQDIVGWSRVIAFTGQSACQAMIAIAALLPSMTQVTQPSSDPRPPWNLWRTG